MRKLLRSIVAIVYEESMRCGVKLGQAVRKVSERLYMYARVRSIEGRCAAVSLGQLSLGLLSLGLLSLGQLSLGQSHTLNPIRWALANSAQPHSTCSSTLLCGLTGCDRR